ncbi:MAG: tRNA (adenosine(37)-N6)-threonylcarbamoyltransferase complex transferase subunit TsaD, partial [Prevotellaceae bacterium]|nr:tRNA (adenosine(37)-N6)-threonylcarbamoyltransferase complex transferase subunit TsaD [Prevotellaceae bacterium]
ELASRAHQQNIIPVVDAALKAANTTVADLDAVAYTAGPGLLGSLLVGVSFAKGLAASAGIPLIEVNHLQGHVLSHFVEEHDRATTFPSLPFLCLLVSGGHTQIIVVKDYLDFEIIGETIDDAAGEAFDKCAKVMGLPYPGGPVINMLAKEGNPVAFSFAKPGVADLNYSFSGLKTSFLYFLQKKVVENPAFVEENKADLCASIQKTIIDILMDKLIKAASKTGIRDVAIAGGVSANSGLADRLRSDGNKYGWNVFVPERRFTTDNAAMIAVTGYFKYRKSLFASLDSTPSARIRESGI